MQIKTKDADQAAFFWTNQKIKLSRTECKYGYSKKILWFVFEADMTPQQFQTLKNDYRNQKTLVQPKLFSSKRMEIKNLIREKVFS